MGSTNTSVPLESTGISSVQFLCDRGMTSSGAHLVTYTAPHALIARWPLPKIVIKLYGLSAPANASSLGWRSLTYWRIEHFSHAWTFLSWSWTPWPAERTSLTQAWLCLRRPLVCKPALSNFISVVVVRVSSETCFVSKQPKLEPKLVSALSETRRLFRLFRFNIETGSLGVSKQPKQTKDQPKQQQIC